MTVRGFRMPKRLIALTAAIVLAVVVLLASGHASGAVTVAVIGAIVLAYLWISDRTSRRRARVLMAADSGAVRTEIVDSLDTQQVVELYAQLGWQLRDRSSSMSMATTMVTLTFEKR